MALHQEYGPDSQRAQNGGGEIWVSSAHPGVVDTNLSGSVGSPVMSFLSVMRWFGLIWPVDEGSWNTLFCAAGSDMKAEQSGGYIDIFRRFGEPWWQSGAARDGTLAMKLEVWTRATMGKEGWTEVGTN
ncbi:hypothetical protein CNYM01_03247 [Colletotrichum nymphaeae SA-01]|uniref:Uncharacterized protein n=1 Tax=Colletotrichum nymphaeae SA-01 TaxID=1460502 RepID=A0A135SXC0_9PEZI|nr:hypothetical protein CNYM01_03247 [Colletotrichum nymphaeae SA-01]